MDAEIKDAVIKAAESLPEASAVREYVMSNLETVTSIMAAEERETAMIELSIEEGKKEGLKEGIDQTLISNIRSLMKKLQMTTEEAMDILAIPSEEHAKYALKLKKDDSVKTVISKAGENNVADTV